MSFHVGSGCRDVSVYTEAIKRAHSVFDMAQQQYGFSPLTLLDIGGGFTAPCDEASSRLFRETAATINAALEQYFPAGCGVDVISEPGRCVLCCCAAHQLADWLCSIKVCRTCS